MFKGKKDIETVLMALSEQLDAARWTITQDPSDTYKKVLKDFLEKIGYKNVAERI
ncbi:MAG: hypothetical protein KAW19_11250 [Candidatus Aminicenantes bacterium]|nr:hypothetical protein [Candidatus Aminicenantes bacterium]